MEYLLDINVVSKPLRPQLAPGIMHGLWTHKGAAITYVSGPALIASNTSHLLEFKGLRVYS